MSQTDTTERRRCIAVVYKRDLRDAHGSRQKFKMHYKKCHCTRFAVCDAGLCRQHMMIPAVETWSAAP